MLSTGSCSSGDKLVAVFLVQPAGGIDDQDSDLAANWRLQLNSMCFIGIDMQFKNERAITASIFVAGKMYQCFLHLNFLIKKLPSYRFLPTNPDRPAPFHGEFGALNV